MFRMHPNSYGDWFETGSTNYMNVGLDLQNVHMSINEVLNARNGGEANGDVDRVYWDAVRYASPTGLLEIMK
jgi:hypothetical protein